MPLRYPFFASNERIQAAGRNAPPLKSGNRALAVAILQGALIDLGYKMPISTRNKGVPDGVYGSETVKTIAKFQIDQKLKGDGVAGKNTIRKLDALMLAKTGPDPPPKKIPPPIPVIPTNRDYMIGTGDPKIAPDAGAGVWNSSSLTVTALAQSQAIERALPVAALVVGGDAADHLRHYFTNSGRDLKIDLVGMVNEVPSAKKFYELEVNQAKAFVEQLPVGSHNITSRRVQGGYNTKNESKNWYFAVGGYSVWGKGKAIVTNGAAGREYQLDFEYKFFDRYNWDTGKSVNIMNIQITDEFMGEFHLQGLAREYNEVGSFKKTFTWKQGSPIPTAQLDPGSR